MNGIENITGVQSLELSKAVSSNSQKVSAAAVETQKSGKTGENRVVKNSPNSFNEAELIKSDKEFQNEVAAKIEKYIDNSNIAVQFGVDKESGKQFFKIVDKMDNKVLKQFPPEEILALAKRLKEFNGSIVNAIV